MSNYIPLDTPWYAGRGALFVFSALTEEAGSALHATVGLAQPGRRERGHGEVAGQENGPEAAPAVALAAARLAATLKERAASLAARPVAWSRCDRLR
jgi:hypothetical protein